MLGTMAVGSAYPGLYYPPLGTTPPSPSPDTGGGTGSRKRRIAHTTRYAAEARAAGIVAPDLVSAFVAARERGRRAAEAKRFVEALPIVAAQVGVQGDPMTATGIAGLPWIVLLAAWEWLEEWT